MKDYDYLLCKYLNACKSQKCLSPHTLRAYRIDLEQFIALTGIVYAEDITPCILEEYIGLLNNEYSPRTVQRKIASLKAFCHYLEYIKIIRINPWNCIYYKPHVPTVLPRIIPLSALEDILTTVYDEMQSGSTIYKRRTALRNAAVLELLFATGIRIFELCSLTPTDVNLNENTILIHGKGAKERILHIGNNQVQDILLVYFKSYSNEITRCNRFFANQSGRPFNDQAARRMINRYTKMASIDRHITPHMWRHTFATSLLEADVDIRYIQKMLGHSSIRTTEIYTHVSLAKQKQILCEKHPRNSFDIRIE